MFTDKFETEFLCLSDIQHDIRYHRMQDVTGEVRVVIAKMVYREVLDAMEESHVGSESLLVFVIRAGHVEANYSPQILDQVLVGLYA